MAIDVDGGMGEAAAVDETGVVEGVAENGVVAAGQCADEGEVGDEAAAEDQGGLGPFPAGEGAFQRPQRRQQAGHQRRRPGAAAVAAGGAGSGGGQARVGGEIQIIVGGKVDEVAAVQADARPLRGLQAAADAVEAAAAAVGQVVFQPGWHEGIRPSRLVRHYLGVADFFAKAISSARASWTYPTLCPAQSDRADAARRPSVEREGCCCAAPLRAFWVCLAWGQM